MFSIRNRSKEFSYIVRFVRGFEPDDLQNREIKEQLRSLWVAYCIHWNLDVDTRSYDDDIVVLWEALREETGLSTDDFNRFYAFMATHLV